MNISQSFDDLGVNAIAGTSLMGFLGLSPQDLMFPQKFAKLQSVIDYLKHFPEDTQRFLITKSTRGKMVDKLDHVFEYTNLLKDKERIEKSIEILEKEKSAVFSDLSLSFAVEEKLAEERIELSKLSEEIAIYE